MKRFVLCVAFVLAAGLGARAQFWDSGTGLLMAPSAEMNEDGTLMITGNFMNRNSISSRYWGYDTWSYGLNLNLWSRLEIGYVCVLMDSAKKPNYPEGRVRLINQDRHFSAKLLLLREGEFGLDWMPALAVGTSDPVTGARKKSNTDDDYLSNTVSGAGNGFFNRNYIVATKHFATPVGPVGAHLGYQWNHRSDFPMNGPCAAVDWTPVWLQSDFFALRLIAEYDARTVNLGAIASVWKDRFEVMFNLQALKWVSFGLRYKLILKS